ncbi:MAG: GreA/GreB family elongation factor, partial [Phycisphaerae bacterium]|nr:GreA/GreB family elongation factor [Phycisphaerae bacterium]
HGDLSENSEYKFALEERDLLRARAAGIQDDLSLARLIEPHIVPTDRVGVGSRVRVKSTDGAVEQELVFLGPWDAAIDRHIYNYKAPLSQRLMGLAVGETVELELDGVPREYRIEAVQSTM